MTQFRKISLLTSLNNVASDSSKISGHGNLSYGVGISYFSLRNISQNEFSEIDTYPGGGYVPTGRL